MSILSSHNIPVEIRLYLIYDIVVNDNCFLERRKTMAKKKNYWYVLVMSDDGPVFVTKINYGDRTAEWNKLEKPLEMDKDRAQELTLGLNLNLNISFAVCQPFELDHQPYRYSDWHIEWTENEKEVEE